MATKRPVSAFNRAYDEPIRLPVEDLIAASEVVDEFDGRDRGIIRQRQECEAIAGAAIEDADGQPTTIWTDRWQIAPARMFSMVENAAIGSLGGANAMEIEGMAAGIGKIAVIIEAAAIRSPGDAGGIDVSDPFPWLARSVFRLPQLPTV